MSTSSSWISRGALLALVCVFLAAFEAGVASPSSSPFILRAAATATAEGTRNGGYFTYAPYTHDPHPPFQTNCTAAFNRDKAAGIHDAADETHLNCARRPNSGIYGAFGDYVTLSAQCKWWDEETETSKTDREACIRLIASIFWWTVPVAIPFLALVGFAPAFIIGRYVFNCCGGRLPSYSACCPQGDERAVFTGYSALNVWSHKIALFGIFLFVVGGTSNTIDISWPVWVKRGYTFASVPPLRSEHLLRTLIYNHTNPLESLVWNPWSLNGTDPDSITRRSAKTQALPQFGRKSTTATSRTAGLLLGSIAAPQPATSLALSSPRSRRTVSALNVNTTSIKSKLFTNQEAWLIRHGLDGTLYGLTYWNVFMRENRRGESISFGLVVGSVSLIAALMLVFLLISCCNGGAALIIGASLLALACAAAMVIFTVSHFYMWRSKLLCTSFDQTIVPWTVGLTQTFGACNITATRLSKRFDAPFPALSNSSATDAVPMYPVPAEDAFSMVYVANDVTKRFTHSFALWQGLICGSIRMLCRLTLQNETLAPQEEFQMFRKCDKTLVRACHIPPPYSSRFPDYAHQSIPAFNVTADDVSFEALNRTIHDSFAVATIDGTSFNFSLRHVASSDIPVVMLNRTLDGGVSIADYHAIVVNAELIVKYSEEFTGIVAAVRELAYVETDCREVYELMDEEVRYRVCDSSLLNDYAGSQGFYAMTIVFACLAVVVLVKGIKRFRSDKCCPFPLAPLEPGYTAVNQTATLAETQAAIYRERRQQAGGSSLEATSSTLTSPGLRLDNDTLDNIPLTRPGFPSRQSLYASDDTAQHSVGGGYPNLTSGATGGGDMVSNESGVTTYGRGSSMVPMTYAESNGGDGGGQRLQGRRHGDAHDDDDEEMLALPPNYTSAMPIAAAAPISSSGQNRSSRARAPTVPPDGGQGQMQTTQGQIQTPQAYPTAPLVGTGPIRLDSLGNEADTGDSITGTSGAGRGGVGVDASGAVGIEGASNGEGRTSTSNSSTQQRQRTGGIEVGGNRNGSGRDEERDEGTSRSRRSDGRRSVRFDPVIKPSAAAVPQPYLRSTHQEAPGTHDQTHDQASTPDQNEISGAQNGEEDQERLLEATMPSPSPQEGDRLLPGYSPLLKKGHHNQHQGNGAYAVEALRTPRRGVGAGSAGAGSARHSPSSVRGLGSERAPWSTSLSPPASMAVAAPYTPTYIAKRSSPRAGRSPTARHRNRHHVDENGAIIKSDDDSKSTDGSGGLTPEYNETSALLGATAVSASMRSHLTLYSQMQTASELWGPGVNNIEPPAVRVPDNAADPKLWLTGAVKGTDGVVRNYAVPPQFMHLISPQEIVDIPTDSSDPRSDQRHQQPMHQQRPMQGDHQGQPMNRFYPSPQHQQQQQQQQQHQYQQQQQVPGAQGQPMYDGPVYDQYGRLLQSGVPMTDAGLHPTPPPPQVSNDVHHAIVDVMMTDDEDLDDRSLDDENAPPPRPGTMPAHQRHGQQRPPAAGYGPPAVAAAPLPAVHNQQPVNVHEGHGRFNQDSQGDRRFGHSHPSVAGGGYRGSAQGSPAPAPIPATESSSRSVLDQAGRPFSPRPLQRRASSQLRSAMRSTTLFSATPTTSFQNSPTFQNSTTSFAASPPRTALLPPGASGKVGFDDDSESLAMSASRPDIKAPGQGHVRNEEDALRHGKEGKQEGEQKTALQQFRRSDALSMSGESRRFDEGDESSLFERGAAAKNHNSPESGLRHRHSGDRTVSTTLSTNDQTASSTLSPPTVDVLRTAPPPAALLPFARPSSDGHCSPAAPGSAFARSSGAIYPQRQSALAHAAAGRVVPPSSSPNQANEAIFAPPQGLVGQTAENGALVRRTPPGTTLPVSEPTEPTMPPNMMRSLDSVLVAPPGPAPECPESAAPSTDASAPARGLADQLFVAHQHEQRQRQQQQQQLRLEQERQRELLLQDIFGGGQVAESDAAPRAVQQPQQVVQQVLLQPHGQTLIQPVQRDHEQAGQDAQPQPQHQSSTLQPRESVASVTSRLAQPSLRGASARTFPDSTENDDTAVLRSSDTEAPISARAFNAAEAVIVESTQNENVNRVSLQVPVEAPSGTITVPGPMPDPVQGREANAVRLPPGQPTPPALPAAAAEPECESDTPSPPMSTMTAGAPPSPYASTVEAAGSHVTGGVPQNSSLGNLGNLLRLSELSRRSAEARAREESKLGSNMELNDEDQTSRREEAHQEDTQEEAAQVTTRENQATTAQSETTHHESVNDADLQTVESLLVGHAGPQSMVEDKAPGIEVPAADSAEVEVEGNHGASQRLQMPTGSPHRPAEIAVVGVVQQRVVPQSEVEVAGVQANSPPEMTVEAPVVSVRDAAAQNGTMGSAPEIGIRNSEGVHVRHGAAATPTGSPLSRLRTKESATSGEHHTADGEVMSAHGGLHHHLSPLNDHPDGQDEDEHEVDDRAPVEPVRSPHQSGAAPRQPQWRSYSEELAQLLR